MPRVANLLLPARRAAFTKAFNDGLGLSTPDRLFVQATSANPGRRFVYALLLGYAIAAAVFLSLYYTGVSERTVMLVYNIAMSGLVLGVVLGAVFLGAMAADFLSHRLERAGAVAECTAAGTSLQQCHEKVSRQS